MNIFAVVEPRNSAESAYFIMQCPGVFDGMMLGFKAYIISYLIVPFFLSLNIRLPFRCNQYSHSVTLSLSLSLSLSSLSLSPYLSPFLSLLSQTYKILWHPYHIRMRITNIDLLCGSFSNYQYIIDK